MDLEQYIADAKQGHDAQERNGINSRQLEQMAVGQIEDGNAKNHEGQNDAVV